MFCLPRPSLEVGCCRLDLQGLQWFWLLFLFVLLFEKAAATGTLLLF